VAPKEALSSARKSRVAVLGIHCDDDGHGPNRVHPEEQSAIGQEQSDASKIASIIAAATLHVVDAYRAIEALSESEFPAGAPYSFELACQSICTALIALDECSAEWAGSDRFF
jgi:hypothetical protein